jgi:hypothetical protein
VRHEERALAVRRSIDPDAPPIGRRSAPDRARPAAKWRRSRSARRSARWHAPLGARLLASRGGAGRRGTRRGGGSGARRRTGHGSGSGSAAPRHAECAPALHATCNGTLRRNATRAHAMAGGAMGTDDNHQETLAFCRARRPAPGGKA